MKTDVSQKNKKYIMYGAAAILLFFLFRKKGSAAQEANLLNQESQAEENQAGGNKTFPDSQYFAFANRLEQAMFDWGTDEAAILDVFNQLQNNADYLALKTAFGVRDYTGGIVPYIPLISPKLSLEGWLQEELSSSYINEINTMLYNKGITYRV
jgi:hypothetical protein